MVRPSLVSLAACLFAVVGVALLPAALHSQERPQPQQVAVALLSVEAGPDDPLFWNAALQLEELNEAAVPALRESLGLEHPDRRRLLATSVLVGRPAERQGAIGALHSLVLVGTDRSVRLTAIRLLELNLEDGELLDGLLEAVEDAPLIQVAVARLLHTQGGGPEAVEALLRHAESEDRAVQAEAAIALTECGKGTEQTDALMARLSREPSERGQRARAVRLQAQLYDAIQAMAAGEPQEEALARQRAQIDDLKEQVADLREQLAAGSSLGSELLDELSRKIQLYYDYQEADTIRAKRLLDEAAKGMVASLDPYSSYMTEEETEAFDTTMAQDYAGIGAVVSIDPKDQLLTIIRPIYSGPAYEMGLRSLDKVVEIDGKPTVGRRITELVSRLKGTAGTPVTISVMRKGWAKPREMTIVRARINLRSVLSTMLPGKIGYISLSQFGKKADQEVEAALSRLEEEGMAALIFDLRSNSGGLLTAAVSVASKFMEPEQLVCYSKGRNPYLAPLRRYQVPSSGRHRTIPVVVLVNGASASASEIVAGALQAQGRALLVGTRTFGKGSVQQLIPVKATDGASTLRLTIARYYLPDDRNIDKVGITPDILVELPIPSATEEELAEALEESGRIQAFVETQYPEHAERLQQLARFDDRDWTQYPGFDALRASLAELGAPDQTVRRLVRQRVRRAVQDERGQQFAVDIQEDIQLRRAILEALRAVGTDPAQFLEYSTLHAEFGE